MKVKNQLALKSSLLFIIAAVLVLPILLWAKPAWAMPPPPASRIRMLLMNQTLTASLAANPDSGDVPLNGVSLTATPGGDATGTINYTFYCNRSDTATNITPGWDAKFDGVSDIPKIAANICNYPDAGNYQAKVIIERGTASPAQAQTTVRAKGAKISPCGSFGDVNGDGVVSQEDMNDILSYVVGSLQFSSDKLRLADVNNDGKVDTLDATTIGNLIAGNITIFPVCTLSVALVANPNSGPAPLNPTLIATVGGNATGTINYTFYCNRADSGTDVTEGWADKFDGISENPKSTGACVFQTAGTYTAKVITERGGAAAEARATVTVTNTLGATLAASPTDGTRPLNDTLTATRSGTATGPVNYTFWWNCNNSGTSVSDVIKVCGNPDGEPGNTIGQKFDQTNYNVDYKSVDHIYDKAGTFVPKVIIEQGTAQPAEARAKVVVNEKTKASPCAPYGDLNNNKSVGTDDIDLIQGYLDKKVALSDSQKAMADVDGQNGVDAADINLIRQYLDNAATTFPICTLSAKLTPDPSTGYGPLNVSLKGEAVGVSSLNSVTYNFWWNCSSESSDLSALVNSCGQPNQNGNDVGKIISNVSGNPPSQTVNNTYRDVNTYTAKLLIIRDGATSAEARANISVNSLPSKASPCGDYGDVIIDGKVDQQDYQAVSDYSVGMRTLAADELKRADVNNDSAVDLKDAEMIKNYLIGQIPTFDVCTVSPPTPGQITILPGKPLTIKGSLVAGNISFNIRQKNVKNYAITILYDSGILNRSLPGFDNFTSIILNK